MTSSVPMPAMQTVELAQRYTIQSTFYLDSVLVPCALIGQRVYLCWQTTGCAAVKVEPGSTFCHMTPLFFTPTVPTNGLIETNEEAVLFDAVLDPCCPFSL